MNHVSPEFLLNPGYVPHIDPQGTPFDIAVMKNYVEWEMRHVCRDAEPSPANITRSRRMAKNRSFRRFVAEFPSYTPITDLVGTIHRNVRCNEAVVVCALVILDKLATMKPSLVMNPFTVRRLLVTAIVIACKDTGNFREGDLAHYASVVQIYDNDLLGQLEVDMRTMLNENTSVSYDEYRDKISIMLGRLGIQRFKMPSQNSM